MSRNRNDSSRHAAHGTSSAQSSSGDRNQPRDKLHSAFWITVRRVTVLAAMVDVTFLIFFLIVGSPLLAWLNIGSIALYATAYLLLTRRQNLAALLLIWLEVVAHAAIGTLLVGWDSGFHYYLLMFIPAIVVSGSRRTVMVLLTTLFALYMGLHESAHLVGPMAPLGDTPLLLLNVFNVFIFFSMAGYTTHFYSKLVRKSEHKLRELATHDTLTGLSNRRHLLDIARQEIARAIRTGQALSVVLADIADFQRINDGFGHDAGDQVLVHAGELLRATCRAHDTVARWGGEEFLFLLPSTDQKAAIEFAERLRQRVRASQVVHGDELFLYSLSIGVATLAEGESLERAIGRADRALYRSKSEGRDRVTGADHPLFDDVSDAHLPPVTPPTSDIT
jgi:diguanylate cyclase (GGDEF)-like protein